MKPLYSLTPVRLTLTLLLGIALGSGIALCIWPRTVLAQDASPSRPQATKESDDKKEESEDAAAKKEKKPKSARWQVSWGVDPDIAKLTKPTPTTIAHLLTFKRPTDLPGAGTVPENYRTHRIAHVETTLWAIEGTVVSVAAEHDGDYRLIVADKKGGKVCCVLPDPALAPKTSRLSAQIDAARAVVVKKFHPTFTARDVQVPVKIVSPGYFGRFNKEENPSPEGFQLHPVVGVRFVNQ